MLYVPVYVAPSSIHGQGVFTQAPIPRGTLIWKKDRAHDLHISPQAVKGLVELLGPGFRKALETYAYYDQAEQCFILHTDGLQYMNHSSTPNTVSEENGSRMLAAVDIPAHTELTEDYLVSYPHDPSVPFGTCASFLA